ncbi:MAG: S1 RNA-binding domain-containing protein [Firmicutes bacterium]|nr:S1 RNA-binding domain-containing protein [Bacillota bacterium]
MSFEIGSIVEGTISGITNFGAFVELPESKIGLIHISEVSDTFVEDIRQHLKEKDKVRVKVIGINEKGKYDLSIKQTIEKERSRRPRSQVQSHEAPTFEDKLARFMKESEERQLDLKKNTEAKRGRGRSSR